MKHTEIVAALGALAQESRLAVYRLLVKRGPGGFTPGELAENLVIAAPTLSFHLRELQRVGLALVRREGRHLYYTANFVEMRKLVGYLSENCCSLADETCDANCLPIAAAKISARKKRA